MIEAKTKFGRSKEEEFPRVPPLPKGTQEGGQSEKQQGTETKQQDMQVASVAGAQLALPQVVEWE